MPAGSSPLTRGKRPRHEREISISRLIPAHAGKTRRARSSRLWASAHPRSRGENQMPVSRTKAPGGSSPLTRGKLSHQRRLPACIRLIPAHAGKTLRVSLMTRTRPAHPRSRGENLIITGTRGARAGSSPLTRGKRRPPISCQRWRGLIPAHAGKTRSRDSGVSPREAHPRSRGENSSMR